MPGGSLPRAVCARPIHKNCDAAQFLLHFMVSSHIHDVSLAQVSTPLVVYRRGLETLDIACFGEFRYRMVRIDIVR